MAEDMKETGTTIKCMARAVTNGKMAVSMKDSTKKTKSMDSDAIHGRMADDTMVNGLTARDMEEAVSSTLMEASDKESGKWTEESVGSTKRPQTKVT